MNSQPVQLSPDINNKLLSISKHINLDKLFEEIVNLINNDDRTLKYCKEKYSRLYNFFVEKQTFPKYNLDKLFNVIVNTLMYMDIIAEDYESLIYELIAMNCDVMDKQNKRNLSFYQNKYKYLYVSFNYLFELVFDKYFIDGINFNSTKIMLDVLDIQEYYNKWKTQRLNITKPQFEKNMKEKHMYLYTVSSTIFTKAVNGGFAKTEDIETLEYIFSKASNIKNGKISQSDADKEVGAKFGNIYLPKPNNNNDNNSDDNINLD